MGPAAPEAVALARSSLEALPGSPQPYRLPEPSPRPTVAPLQHGAAARSAPPQSAGPGA